MSVYIKGRNDPEASGQISRTSPIMSRLPEAVQSWYKDSSTATWDVPFILVLLMFEAVICTAIIQLVPYTEIDWQAYMEQVTTFQGGQRNYLNIRGGTGPLVYPAGFLYMYSFFQKIAGGDGTDIDAAQNSFAVVYLLQAALILYLYTLVARQQATTMAKYFITQDPNLLVRYPFATAHCIWSWRMAMFFGCCLSKRIHSIFVLRLFNDGPAMVLLYISVVFFVKAYWKIGCVFFSLAVSIKMNILLFAPGLLLLLLQGQSNIYGTIVCLSICAGIQLFLGYPFLSTYPVAYLRKSFELDRVFMHKWTVNWKFLDEDIFVSEKLSLILLVCHVSFLGAFACKWLTACQQRYRQQLFLCVPIPKRINRGTTRVRVKSPPRLTAEYVCMTMFVSNYIGIAMARTLHYQFYEWYYHTLAMMLWSTDLKPWPIRFILIGVIEYAFNTFPATPESSAILQAAHAIILLSLLFVLDVPQPVDDDGTLHRTPSQETQSLKTE